MFQLKFSLKIWKTFRWREGGGLPGPSSGYALEWRDSGGSRLRPSEVWKQGSEPPEAGGKVLGDFYNFLIYITHF